jgi:hypothetical protein
MLLGETENIEFAVTKACMQTGIGKNWGTSFFVFIVTRCRILVFVAKICLVKLLFLFIQHMWCVVRKDVQDVVQIMPQNLYSGRETVDIYKERWSNLENFHRFTYNCSI